MTVEWKWFNGVDVTGINPNNKFTEEIDLSDKTLRHVVPSYTPFFSEGLVVKNSAGGILKTGFAAVKNSITSELYTGKHINMFLDLDQFTVTSNSKITITYQALSTHSCPRNKLVLLWLSIQDTMGGDIDWGNITGKPDTYPSEKHTHDMESELRGFEEFTYFMKLMKGYTGLYTDATEGGYLQYQEYYARLYQIRNDAYSLVQTHAKDNNAPHGPDKNDIALGNVDNFKLATVQQDIDGILDNVFSTPHGINSAMVVATPDTSGLLKCQGTPFSFYGDMGFLPPPIGGGFEGIGSYTDMSAIVLEDDGTLLFLNQRTDGRVRGLYFSKCLDYLNSTETIYTSHRYVSPVEAADGLIFDYVIAGSNEKIMMLGDYVANKWYCTLTNGTLNPDAHSLVYLDISRIANFDPPTLTIHHFGDWIYLFQCGIYTESGGETRGNGKTNIYKFSTSALNSTAPIIAMPVTINYDDVYRNRVNGSLEYVMSPTTYNDGGKVTSYVWEYDPPIDYVNNHRRKQFISAAISGHPTKFAIKTITLFYAVLTGYNGGSYSHSWSVEFLHEYDTNTETFSLSENSIVGGRVFNITSGPHPGNDDSVVADIRWFTSYKTNSSAIALPNGDIILGNGNMGLPYEMGVLQNLGCDAYQTVSSRLTNANFPNGKARDLSESYYSPIGLGIKPGSVAYDGAGEYTRTLVDGVQKFVYRVVSGEYEFRPEITNLYHEIKSRPLSNKTYGFVGNDQRKCVISITGSKSKLDSLGIPYGKILLSANGYHRAVGGVTSSLTNQLTSAKTPNNGDILMDNEFIKVLSGDTFTFDVSSYIRYPKAIVDKLISGCGAVTEPNTGTRAMTIVIYDLTNTAPNTPSIMVLQYLPEGTTVLKNVVVTFTPTYNKSGNEYVVSDVTFGVAIGGTVTPTLLLVEYGDFVISKNNEQAITRLYCDLYIDDDGMIDVVFNAYHHFLMVTDQATSRYYITLNPKNGGMDVISTSRGYRSYTQAGSNYFTLYNVGICVGVDTTFSGYAPLIVRKLVPRTLTKLDEFYLVISPYTESSWTIFFKSEETLILNGAQYTLPPGSVYLYDIDPNPANKIFYVYATVLNGKPQYVLTTDPKTFDSADNLLVAKVVTDAAQVVTISGYKPFAIGGKVINTQRLGQSIPGSSGGINEKGGLPWVYKSELI